MVHGALIGTTLTDIFSIDPATCAENWRTREDVPASILTAMRGAAYLDGMLFRGSQDGRVLAYDFKTGKRIWQTTIADRTQGRVRRRRSDRLERAGLHRQCGRRRQGRQGAHVRARRQDRQNRVGVLSRSEDRDRRGPRTARSLAARQVDLGQRAGIPDQRRRDLDVIHARRGGRRTVRASRATRGPLTRSACARARISIPTRSSCSTP